MQSTERWEHDWICTGPSVWERGGRSTTLRQGSCNRGLWPHGVVGVSRHQSSTLWVARHVHALMEFLSTELVETTRCLGRRFISFTAVTEEETWRVLCWQLRWNSVLLNEPECGVSSTNARFGWKADIQDRRLAGRPPSASSPKCSALCRRRQTQHWGG